MSDATNTVEPDLPAPPVPPDADLRSFTYMPVDVRRLLGSESWLKGTGDERAAAVTLLLESWHQTPAGSLPVDERALARLSQAGAMWKRVRAHALRGWRLHSDGRLYHHVIVEKVLAALEAQARNAKRREADGARLQRWRDQKRADNASGTPDETRFTLRRKGEGQGEGEEKSESSLCSDSDTAKRREAPLRVDERRPSRLTVLTGGKAVENAFADFWKAYPRKVGKDTARAAFVKACRRVAPATIVAALQVQQAWPCFRDAPPDKVPHPTTWLNGGRWEDEAPPPTRPGPICGQPQVNRRAWTMDPPAAPTSSTTIIDAFAEEIGQP